MVAHQINHQYHQLMQMDSKIPSFRDESGLQSQPDTNEKREIQELKTDVENFQERNKILMPLVYSDDEVSEIESRPETQNTNRRQANHRQYDETKE